MSISFFRVAALATTILTSSVLFGSAFAEVVYNRGNSADPEGLDPQKTSTINAASATADRLKILSEAERVLIDDQGNIRLLYYSNRNIVSPKLKGFQENVMNVHPTRFMTIE